MQETKGGVRAFTDAYIDALAIWIISMNEKLTPTQARQSVKVSAMRLVLGLGLAGAVLALMIVWFVMR